MLIKKLLALMVGLLLLAGVHASAQADSFTVTPFVSPDAHALLLECNEAYFLVGGGDEEAIRQEMKEMGIDRLAGIVAPCAHEEHTSALESLAAHFDAAILTEDTAAAAEGIDWIWQETGVGVRTEKDAVFFGAQEAVDEAIAYRCDGTVWDFYAQTNEGSVNVRGTATTKGKRVGKLQRGSYLTVNGVTRNANNEVWYLVTLADGTEGYIRCDLLEHVSADEMEAQAQATKAPKTEKYIGNVKSKKFHRTSCGSLPASKNQVYFSSRSYAVSKGYTPCGKCNP